MHLPKCSLDAPDIVFVPIPLCHLLLADWHTLPAHPHYRDSVCVILVEYDLQPAVVSLNPLSQSPLLDDLRGLCKFEVLATNVAAEELEFPAYFRAFEELWWGAGEGCDPLRVGEGGVELSSCRSELFRGVQACSINRRMAGCIGCSDLGG